MVGSPGTGKTACKAIAGEAKVPFSPSQVGFC